MKQDLRNGDFDWDYFDRRTEELAEQGVILECPDQFASRPMPMGVYKGGLIVWFTEPDPHPLSQHWHMHISVQGWHTDMSTYIHEGGSRVAEWDNGNGMRVLRPETFAEALDAAVEIVTNPALARKHRDYYVTKRIQPAIESAEKHLARLKATASNIQNTDLSDSILDAKPPPRPKRNHGVSTDV